MMNAVSTPIAAESAVRQDRSGEEHMPSQDCSLSDQDLIAAVNAGDFDAFALLYDRYESWVMRLAWRFTGNHDDSLDVLQETFSYVAGKFPGFQLTCAMTTFLYPAVRNLSITVRKRSRRASGNAEQLDLLHSQPTEPETDRDEFAEMLGTLSADHREILLMRFVDEMTQPEISEALGIPLGTVKSRLHHAVGAVRSSPFAMRLLGAADNG